ncbi:carboxypeptidase-like regulatory domain-containing protein [Longimicrobium sp.]|uniref:carboxypeptidase-like regulatory domain-containing protein n=1 Tax=Longimicrobium sp. TaxID=2029185 RepID=UPI002E32BD19|nr:carboxypeptidase-like regulatory domain-containing protein [Longimicrobium sp.]HEX6042075.1 carboxypeptidase-like regulatory domain-containing protein [Longimicrobium sp.]
MPPRHTGRPRPILTQLPFLLAFSCALLASPIAAQTVRATVVDAAEGTPIPEALVRVEAEDGTVVGAAFTREDGTAVVRLREGGSFRVTAHRGGHDPATQPLVAASSGTVQVQLRLSRRPFAIDTVQVIARSRDETGRQGFERRRLTNDGVFLDSAYLAQRRTPMLNDFLVGVPGFTTWAGRNGRQVRPDRGWRCMVTLLDGDPPPGGEERRLDRMIYTRDVIAMEVYREYAEVPPEFREHARQGIYPCGVLLYWTRVGWERSRRG